MERIREINDSSDIAGRGFRRVVMKKNRFLRTEVLRNDKVSDDHFDTAASCRTVLMKVVVARVKVRSRR